KATLALVAAVLLAGGFFAGYVIKGDGASATASSGRQMGAGGFPGGNAEGGAPGAPSGAGAAGGGITAGTVSSVDGDTITIKTADGKSVKVKTGTSTTVTLNTEGSVSDLASGDSVVVRGETADGTLKAESITEGSFGGFGGRPSDATTN
ncbi:MAG: hypothetical protein JWP10_331, partial [Nocardioidaceae bacterium]|nr:hypothetical protein [Nocardioidaceae bacterium]